MDRGRVGHAERGGGGADHRAWRKDPVCRLARAQRLAAQSELRGRAGGGWIAHAAALDGSGCPVSLPERTDEREGEGGSPIGRPLPPCLSIGTGRIAFASCACK